MATGEAIFWLLVVLAITSSVTSMYHVQSPDDVSQLARHDANSRYHATSQSLSNHVKTRRTPGWGKRHDGVRNTGLEQAS